jgi:molybdenum cofactor guanylyltransferase
MMPPIAMLRPAASFPPTLGIVLTESPADGRERGGCAMTRIGGATILERVVARARPQCCGLVLAAQDAAPLARFGLPILADAMPHDAGALACILAGLDWTAQHMPATEWLVSLSGAAPFIPDDLLGRLHGARLAAQASLVIASSAGRPHPLIGLWPVVRRADLRRALVEEGVRAPEAYVWREDAVPVEWSAEPFDPFFQVESLDDIVMAERIAARLGRG